MSASARRARKPQRDGQAPATGSDFRAHQGRLAITKIYTRKGDAGQTSLATGERLSKDEARIEAIGAVDELVAALGLARAEAPDAELGARLIALQSQLYLLMASLSQSAPARAAGLELPADAVAKLEEAIDGYDAALPPLKDFVMPGESRASAALHVARTTCRRAERRVVRAGTEAPGASAAVAYLNRLSDLLFVMARAADHDAGREDRTFKSAL